MIKSRGLIIITLILSLFNVSWPKRRFRSLISERKGPWRGPCHSCAMRTGFKKCDSVQLTQRTFKGWPYKISCELLYHRMDEYNAIAPVDEYFLYNEGEGSGKEANPNATCVIRDENNRILLRKTKNFPKKFRELHHVIRPVVKSQQYSVVGWFNDQANRCFAIRLNIVAEKFKEVSCEQSLMKTNHSERWGRLKEQKLLHCDVPDSMGHSLHVDEKTNYSSTWYRDCKKLPHQRLWAQRSGKKDGFVIPRLHYNDSGIYSCAVSVNGMTRFVNHYEICVLPEHKLVEIGLKCRKTTYRAFSGHDVIMTCTSSFQPTKEIFYDITWTKVTPSGSEVVCRDVVDSNPVSSNSTPISCSSKPKFVCLKTPPNKNEEKDLFATLVLNLNIENVKEKDFGEYILSVKSLVSSSNESISLRKYVNPSLKEVSSMMIIYIVLLFLLVTTMLVSWKFRIYILVFWRRKFSKYEADDKKYGAYFSYFYSWDDDGFARQQLRNAVGTVRGVLTGLGYRVFDEGKDGFTFGDKAEASLSHMSDSHRVVIILTVGFLHDHWKIFTLQKGFEEAILSNSKMIFILFPGIKEYIKQHASHSDTVRMVRRAIKLNSAVEWSDDRSFDQKLFSLRLEYKMPKLNEQPSSRHSSTSSSMTSHVQYKTGIQRTLSNDTGLTEVPTPVSPENVFVDFCPELSPST